MMWRPVRDKDKEAAMLIKYYAEQGMQKEVDKLNKKIQKRSDALFEATGTKTTKRCANMRMELSGLCEERDRLDHALEMLAVSGVEGGK